mmetsp:Transcript_15099/g.26733  ORF Transcript_15099/g.26733 Transcript_15099/m.26733 type:complete len:265 (-) Transcript_15099:38-832(-)
MGACPSVPGGLSLGCNAIGELSLPKRHACHDCFVGDLFEAHGNAADPIEGRSLSGEVFSSQLVSRSTSQEAESPIKLAIMMNADFAKELRGLPAEALRTHVERIIREWREKLRAGMELPAGSERLTIAFDPALQCLDCRESGALYPLAALHECTYLPGSSDGSLGLRLEFNDSEVLVFQFETGTERAAFALTLHSLALEACKDKWHEDRPDEGWADEDEDGTSTAEPDDDNEQRGGSNCGSNGREASSDGGDNSNREHRALEGT